MNGVFMGDGVRFSGVGVSGRIIGLGDGVTEIQASAFSGCGALRRVELPEGLTAIADLLEKGCIPQGAETIRWHLIQGCTL